MCPLRLNRSLVARPCGASSLTPEIDRRDLLALMAKLAADGQPLLVVPRLLRRGQLTTRRAPGRRRGPPRQFLITLLGIGVTQAVQLVQSSLGRLSLINLHMLHIGALGRNQGAPRSSVPSCLANYSEHDIVEDHKGLVCDRCNKRFVRTLDELKYSSSGELLVGQFECPLAPPCAGGLPLQGGAQN